MSVWTLLNNWPMSDRYASIYDWCNWHRIDYLRFYSRVPTIERWPWVSNRQTVQNCPKLHHKYILYLIGDQCDWEIGLFDHRWGLMLKKKFLHQRLPTDFDFRWPSETGTMTKSSMRELHVKSVYIFIISDCDQCRRYMVEIIADTT